MNFSFLKFWFLTMGFIASLMITPVNSQSLNGLSMDGIDDYVAVSGSSALVANLSSFSMACWVYPTNAAPSYPDFDGIMGFRNDVNADFYVLQLSATTYEARFRNSAGTIHTLIQGPVLLNQWQHLALVYTGSSLRFYHNGNLAGSMNATGMITNTNIPLEIGRLSFSSNPFYLNGNIDEAALWGRALSDNEVMCLFKQQLDSASAGLLSYYPMDQGIAGGNNVSVPYLEDIKGGYHGFFYGLNLTGSNSNFVTGRQMMGILRDTLCRGESLVYGGTTYQQAGQFRVRLPRPDQCDSTVCIVIKIDTADRRISVNRNQLSAVQTGAITYQWINSAGTAIQGATNRNYTATSNGTYRVVMRMGSCMDTSYPALVSTVGLPDELNTATNRAFLVFPNPGTHWVQLIPLVNGIPLILEVYSIAGKMMHRQDKFSEVGETFHLITSDWPNGLYQFRLKIRLLEISPSNQHPRECWGVSNWLKQ
ncbi:MAG: hypothetical protein FJ343_06380 [Sphingomonadales bacterium]|nr:hypothetical protein [Sphingomonadales bacterium]